MLCTLENDRAVQGRDQSEALQNSQSPVVAVMGRFSWYVWTTVALGTVFICVGTVLPPRRQSARLVRPHCGDDEHRHVDELDGRRRICRSR